MAEAPPRLLSVVMPAYNEAAVIEATLRALAAELERQDVAYEIIVVNDASSDATAAVVDGLAAELPHVRRIDNAGPAHGYGHAVRAGLAAFAGDAVAVVMADGADDPADLVAYFRAVQQGHDCAFGMRFGRGTVVEGYPAMKRVLNRLGNRAVAWLVGADYTDFTNGFKCFRRHVIAGMQPLVCGQFNLTIEMSLKAVLGGASYAVVPNTWRERSAGTSKFKVLQVGWLYVLTIAYCLLEARLKRGGARR